MITHVHPVSVATAETDGRLSGSVSSRLGRKFIDWKFSEATTIDDDGLAIKIGVWIIDGFN